MALIFSILGAVVASFIGVVTARYGTGWGIVAERSRCDACNAVLPPYALVPVISYICARGRAQCCGSRISFFGPLSELMLGVLFALAYLMIGLTTALPFLLAAFALLLALVLYDLAHQILPTTLLALFVAASAGSAVLRAPSLEILLVWSVVALGIGSFLAALHFFSRGRAMGFADAPLAFGLALIAGDAALSGFLFSFWIGAVIGIVVLAQRPRGSRIGVEVPFAPFLALGFILAFFTQWNPLDIALFLG